MNTRRVGTVVNSIHALFLIVILLTSGCASVPMADASKDSQAKQFATPHDGSNIYVYRNESIGMVAKMSVVIDGRMAGDTAAQTYLLLHVTPGKHTIVSKSETDSMLDITTDNGKNYFVWQEVKMGMWSPRSQLHLMDDEQGKTGVSECKLVFATQ